MLNSKLTIATHRVMAYTLSVLGACVILSCQTASAQSTIFNIPSTDAVAKGKVYFEMDFFSHLESHDKGGFQTYTPRVVVGLGHGVEAGVNLAITDSAAPTAVYVQPNLKWQFYANEKSGVALSAGAVAFVPVKDRDVNDTFGLFYANISEKFKGKYGPRVTFGGYGLGGLDSDADKGGVMLGYEQPLSAKASFVADWFSGHNGIGYVTPGFSFTLPHNGLLNIGYSVGNAGRKNNALFIYYGVTF
jgi:hypothetical protein